MRHHLTSWLFLLGFLLGLGLLGFLLGFLLQKQTTSVDIILRGPAFLEGSAPLTGQNAHAVTL